MTTYTAANEETIRKLFLPYREQWVELAISDAIAYRKGIDSLFPEGYVKIVWNKAIGLIDYDCEIDERTENGLAWIPFSQIDDIRLVPPPSYDEIRRRRAAINGEPRRQEPPKQPAPKPAVTDPWVIVGITRSMTFEQAKAAYREKARLLHPDLNPGRADPEIAVLLTQKTAALNKAFDELKRFYGQR